MTAFALAAVSAAGLAYVFIFPYLSGAVKAQKRQAALMAPSPEKMATRGVDQAKRRKAIAESLREIEEKNRKKGADLEQRITQAGLPWSKSSFIAGSALFALSLGAIVFFGGGDTLVALGAAVTGGLGVPKWFLSFLRKRRMNDFLEEFPHAIDVVIRGVKAGMPVADCFRIVASDGQEPVRSEFRKIVESQAVGLSIGEAVERFAERVPTPEASFFSIVINVQQKSGGNLSEALSNLSGVLRDRKKMKAKVKAMSSEAKSSAGIIGSLPFIVGAAVFFTTPSYMKPLFTTDVGNMIIGGSLLWMALGVFVMRSMINFDF